MRLKEIKLLLNTSAGEYAVDVKKFPEIPIGVQNRDYCQYETGEFRKEVRSDSHPPEMISGHT